MATSGAPLSEFSWAAVSYGFRLRAARLKELRAIKGGQFEGVVTLIPKPRTKVQALRVAGFQISDGNVLRSPQGLGLIVAWDVEHHVINKKTLVTPTLK